MIKIICSVGKKSGNEYIALVVNGVMIFDSEIIEKVARSFGYSKRDIYSLEICEEIIMN